MNDLDGIYTYTYEAEKKEDCLACSQIPREIQVENLSLKLKELISILCDRPDLQMKNPGVTANIDGKNKTLYMQAVASIEEKTRENLNRSLVELGLKDGSEIMVADITTPNTVLLKLKFPANSTDVEML